MGWLLEVVGKGGKLSKKETGLVSGLVSEILVKGSSRKGCTVLEAGMTSELLLKGCRFATSSDEGEGTLQWLSSGVVGILPTGEESGCVPSFSESVRRM